MNQHWPLTRLGDIFDIGRGGSPRPIEKFITDDPTGLNWIKIGDATSGGKFIERTREKIKREGLSKTRAVKPGDFLLTNSMSFGRPYIMATEGCIHDGWLLLRPRTEEVVHPDYFYHLLGSDQLYNQFSARAGGSTVKNLNSDIVSSIEIRLPPFDQQRRIAAILDKADALRRKRKRALELLDGLTQSIFLEMFGDPATNPKCLPNARLMDIADFLSGATPSKDNTKYWIGNIPWVSPKDMKRNDIFDAEDHVNEDAIEGSALKLVPVNSILIVIRGMILAHTFPVAMAKRELTINQDMKAIVFREDISPEFGVANIRALGSYVLSQVATAAHGTKRIEMDYIRSLPILMPSLPERQKFTEAVARVGDLWRAASAAFSLASGNFSSLQHRAFTGQL